MESGLSFTEFSYMLLQSADFLHLYRELGVEMQTGGADQWGNITAGLELIRAWSTDADVHALSYPLLTDAAGEKFGKTTPVQRLARSSTTSRTTSTSTGSTFPIRRRPAAPDVHALRPADGGAAGIGARADAGGEAGAAGPGVRHHGARPRARCGRGSAAGIAARFGWGSAGSVVDFHPSRGRSVPRWISRSRRGGVAVGGPSAHRAGRVHGERDADHRSIGAGTRTIPDGEFIVRIGKKRVLIVHVRAA